MYKTSTHPPKLGTSTGSSPRIALIGCGAIAELYFLPVLARHIHMLETLTLVDHDIARAKKLAEAFGIKHYLTDYREALAKNR